MAGASDLPPSLGGQVCDFIESFLCHGPGDVQGRPIELDDEFAAFIWRAYELTPDGHRRYRRAFLSRPKGRAKSELAAMLACAELLGPVRCDGFDAQGEPVGVPVTAPEILTLATEEDQAGFVYLSAKYMLEHGRAGDEYRVDTGLTRTYTPGGGSMEPVTAKASSKDGGKSTFVVADETHLWHTDALRRLHRTVRRNIVKRRIADGWMLECSTAYRPGESSVAEESLEYAKLVSSGKITDSSLLVDHREAQAKWDVSDDDELRQAVVEVYGAAAGWTNVEGILAEFRDPTNDEADNRRYWLNQVVASSEQWIDPKAWAACSSSTAVESGARITLGFDGSQFDDSTALIGCRLEDGHLFVLGMWEKPHGRVGDGWEVPREEVDACVARAFDSYEVVRFYADPPYWQAEVDRWAAEWGDVVALWWTNRDRQMARALERMQTDVLAKALSHDGDDRLATHVANARKREVRAGVLIRKPQRGGPDKIDAAMAAALAYEARGDAIADGALKRKSKAVAFF